MVMTQLCVCLVCRGSFTANLKLVPRRNYEPLCLGCVQAINRRRITLGLEPFAIDSEAYESEVAV